MKFFKINKQRSNSETNRWGFRRIDVCWFICLCWIG